MGDGVGIEQVEQIVSRTGAAATLERRQDGDAITVRDARGRLVFELHENAGVTSIVIPEGDLELRADRGRVRIAGSAGVSIEGPTISMRAQRLVTAVQVMETHAGRILERAKDVYRDVEELSQLRAGHVRIVAKKAFRTLAERVRIKAKKDTHIDGDQIHLG